MSYIKLSIPGQYWDSQIYSNQLFLFGIEGDLKVINDWRKFIYNIFVDSELDIITEVAFLDCSVLYQKAARLMFKDKELQNKILKKFIDFPQEKYLDSSFTDRFLTQVDNPFPYPHTDSEIYNKRIYVCNQDGVFYTNSSISNDLENFIDKDQKATKLWDNHTFSLSGSSGYKSLAFATGSDGLYYQNFENDIEKQKNTEPTLISNSPCNSCHWHGFSIYGVSFSNSYLASFKLVDDENNKNKKKRQFDRIYYSSDIFGESSNGYSWGFKDKLYLFGDNTIKSIEYSQRKKASSPKFKLLDDTSLEDANFTNENHNLNYENIVSAKVAPFGIVIEYDECLAIILSDNKSLIIIDGEPVNWRVFSRSNNYLNHLHIIYDDRLDILTFYNDYFVKQDQKIFGSKAY